MSSLDIHIALLNDDLVRQVTVSAIAEDGILSNRSTFTADPQSASIVVTDTRGLASTPEIVSDATRLLQLVDCGSGAPHATGDDLKIANVSPLLAPEAAERAIDAWEELERTGKSADCSGTRFRVGVIGLGNLGSHIASIANDMGHDVFANDRRTPRQRLLDQVGARRSSLDLLLSRCETIFVSVHHGPTSDPLLARREIGLVGRGAAIVNLSSPKVVDVGAIEEANETRDMRIRYSDISNVETAASPETIADAVVENVRAFAAGESLNGVVENLDFPYAGDPAFWSSKMTPMRDG